MKFVASIPALRVISSKRQFPRFRYKTFLPRRLQKKISGRSSPSISPMATPLPSSRIRFAAAADSSRILVNRRPVRSGKICRNPALPSGGSRKSRQRAWSLVCQAESCAGQQSAKNRTAKNTGTGRVTGPCSLKCTKQREKAPAHLKLELCASRLWEPDAEITGAAGADRHRRWISRAGVAPGRRVLYIRGGLERAA